MLATQTRREGGVEPPQPGLSSHCRHRDFASREKLEHRSPNRRVGDRELEFGVPRSCPRSKRLTSKLRCETKWTGMRVARPLFRFGRPACVSQHLCPLKIQVKLPRVPDQ